MDTFKVQLSIVTFEAYDVTLILRTGFAGPEFPVIFKVNAISESSLSQIKVASVLKEAFTYAFRK